MTYISWTAFHEGEADTAYLDILIPRVIETIVTSEGTHRSEIPATPSIRLGRYGRSIEAVATEACEARDAFEIIFIHADTGGKGVSAGLNNRSLTYCERMRDLCDWPSARCVSITPRHETEAWILADPTAVIEALGYKGDYRKIGLPSHAKAAESLRDPKAVLSSSMRQVTGPRRQRTQVKQLFSAIAQR